MGDGDNSEKYNSLAEDVKLSTYGEANPYHTLFIFVLVFHFIFVVYFLFVFLCYFSSFLAREKCACMLYTLRFDRKTG